MLQDFSLIPLVADDALTANVSDEEVAAVNHCKECCGHKDGAEEISPAEGLDDKPAEDDAKD